MIPVILLTAKGLDKDVIAGLDAGAEDYVTKPFNNLVLSARLRAAVRVKQFHDEMAQVNERFREARSSKPWGSWRAGSPRVQQPPAGHRWLCGLRHRGPLRQEQRYQDLQQVLKATDRAATLTRQLLGFSRRQTFHPKSVDPNQVVADMVKMLRPIIGEQISLQVLPGKDLGTVSGDSGELQQVLLNLCLNARDAMPAGGTLLLKTDSAMLREPYWDPRFEITPGRHVVFSVADTGQGMPTEVRERIFEPFFTTKEVGKGTGLGLAMAYGIVQDHKGAIHVYSEPGKGTTFKVYLPAGSGPVEKQRMEEPALRRAVGKRSSWRRTIRRCGTSRAASWKTAAIRSLPPATARRPSPHSSNTAMQSPW